MRDSWRSFFRRLAVTSVVTCSVAWSSAMCYAVQLAYDDASDDVYDNGWTEGLNGGFGFGPWNFDGTFAGVAGQDEPDDGNQQAIDDGLKTGTQTSTPHNDLGRAWSMFNPRGADPQGTDPSNPPAGTDIARAGRSFSPLEVGQTLSMVFDNPGERAFYRGYSFKLNNVGENLCYGAGNSQTGCTSGTNYPAGANGLKYKVERFEYFTYGQWYDSSALLPLYDIDNAGLGQTGTDAGVQIDFKLTSSTAYELKMTPLDNPGAAAMSTGALDNPADTNPIDWIELQMWNTDSDFYPAMVAGARATDFYVRSMEITGDAPAGVAGDYNNNQVVDAADYTLWRDHLNQSFQLQNEVTDVTPGMVTVEDYNEWKSRFGDTAGGGASLAGTGVPEPATFVYLVAAFLGSLSVRDAKGSKHGDANTER